MEPKPEHYGSAYAETFKDQQVVDAYRYRPPYPDAVFTILLNLLKDEPRAILDVGAGSGDLARRLASHVERVDAVDFSEHMLEHGKQLPDGDLPGLHWLHGKVEEVPLTPPYALITAGSSIHWTEWSVAFPRFCTLLTPAGVVALAYRHTLPTPWSAELRDLRANFDTRRGHESTSMVKELERRGWFHKQGEQETTPVPFTQTIDDFIEGMHSRSAFSREMMGAQKAADFDQQVRNLLLSFQPDGLLPLQVVGTVSWGQPSMGPLV
ncbi:MAG TPA: methyltransferase domain-containing protein [Ktedonobacteraceae bacterium]